MDIISQKILLSETPLDITDKCILSFNQLMADNMNKAMKAIGILRKLQSILARLSLLTIYKSFIRPHLDYGGVIYDQPFDNLFLSGIDFIQYKAVLAKTGAIRSSSSLVKNVIRN